MAIDPCPNTYKPIPVAEVGATERTVNQNFAMVERAFDQLSICMARKVSAISVQGRAGLDGRDGRDGADGRDGNDGQDGRDGADGQDGDDGSAGRDGNDGAAGRDGRDGDDGRDGLDGHDG